MNVVQYLISIHWILHQRLIIRITFVLHGYKHYAAGSWVGLIWLVSEFLKNCDEM